MTEILYCTRTVKYEGRYFHRGMAFPLVAGPIVNDLVADGALAYEVADDPGMTEIEHLRAIVKRQESEIEALRQQLSGKAKGK